MGFKEAASYLVGVLVFLTGLTTTYWLYRYATGWGVYALQNVLTTGAVLVVLIGLGWTLQK